MLSWDPAWDLKEVGTLLQRDGPRWEIVFEEYLNLTKKTASIWFKIDESLGQVRLLLFQASKKAPSSLRNPGYAPEQHYRKCVFIRAVVSDVVYG